MLLSNVSIKRPVFASVIMLALTVLGIASYRRLAVELMPNVEIPVITIITVLPGASPDTVEREVSKKIEEAVNPIAGVRHVMSTSREGVSQVVVEFELEVKTDQAVQDARTKIAAIRGDLPATLSLRTSPILRSAHPSFAWLQRELFIGFGAVDFATLQVAYDVYAVR